MGYIPALERGFIVPTYPAGVPLLMALFQRVAGKGAVFYLVPLLGGLCVWMTSELGSSAHGRLTGVLAALLVATSPSFVTELMVPASDVAATAWWTTALVLTIRGGSLASLGAGAAVSLAILTRPNLVPLAVVVGLFYVWRVVRGRSGAVRSLALFTGAAVPGCLAVAAINQYLYGSPLSSGYEPFNVLYALTNAGPNLDRYPRWLMQTQTPFIALAVAAPLFSRTGSDEQGPARLQRDHVVLLLSFATVVMLSYLFYRPYGREEWEYLRFLLPAYPPLLVLAVAVTIEIVGTTRARATARAVAVLTVCVLLAAWQTSESVKRGALAARLVDQRYVDVGRFINFVLPSNSVVFASLHAGSIRYYSGRQTVNYDRLERRWLDEAVAELRRRGSHPFIALEEGEMPSFRERFSDLNELGGLDWPPMAERREPIRVRIYDPADRDRSRRDETVQTQAIPPAKRW
jgi:4-amino-4-deoxy-L-arabinose transferase-like glycosyltransferase